MGYREMTREECMIFLRQVKHVLLRSKSWLDSTHKPIQEAFDMAIEALEGQKAGKWIAYKGMQPPELNGKHYCSNCYHAIHLALNGNVYNYCPNCGAKMEMK